MADITLYEAARRLDDDYHNLVTRATRYRPGLVRQRPILVPKGSNYAERRGYHLVIDETRIEELRRTTAPVIEHEEAEAIWRAYHEAPPGHRPKQLILSRRFRRPRQIINAICCARGRFAWLRTQGAGRVR